MQKRFQRCQAVGDVVRRRGHKHGVPGPCAADPDLAASKFSRRILAASSSSEQNLVGLSEQSQGKWDPSAQTCETVVERGHVATDFPGIFDRHTRFFIEFEQQQVCE